MAVVCTLAALIVGGCESDQASDGAGDGRPLLPAAVLDSLPEDSGNRLALPFVRAGLEHLQKGQLVEASKGFNRALKFDPRDPNLHFLNALAYHLRGENGDTGQFEYADIGYRVALQYDPGNFWAAYLLGRIAFRDRRFAEAQDAFAYALLLDPDNPKFQLALAASSYYAHDLETAVGAIASAIAQAPDDSEVYRAAAMINAAVGRPDRAAAYLRRYKIAHPEGTFQAANLHARLDDWVHVHQRSGVQLAQSDNDTITITTDDLGTEGATEDVAPDSQDLGGDDNDSGAVPSAPLRMCLIDVTIIRSEEINETNKGVNLLDGLKATLDEETALFQYTYTRTEGSSESSARTRTYGVKVTPYSVTYNLNIFNDTIDSNEILARPTLLAVDGKSSEFFSGAVWHVELVGVAGSEGTVTDIPVGVRLHVTPRFIDDDTVEIDVLAARAFIENNASQAQFTKFAQTSRTTVRATAAMKFGQTLVLSGLSEKETETLRSGVPFLQNIPGIQYLFSNEQMADYNKSVLVLLTPRRPHYVYGDGTPQVSLEAARKTAEQPSLKELKTRPEWYEPAPTLHAIFQHLEDSKLYREFRAGDVRLETWDDPDSLSAIIQRTLSFLYY